MRQIYTTEDIKRLGTIVFVAAHPDDESFLAAGIMAAAVANGQTVACITATRGEAGSQDETKWPPATLGAVRERELHQALRVLGVRHHHFLEYHDGACSEVLTSEAVAQIRSIVQQYQPDTILTFGPEGMTGHPDHQSVSAWTDSAIRNMPHPPRVYHAVHRYEDYDTVLKELDEKLNIFFNIDKPPLVPEKQCAIAFRLPPPIREQKRRALAAMPSQTELLFRVVTPDVIERAFGAEYFVTAPLEPKTADNSL